MAESASLLRTSTFTGTVGSNPTLSDKRKRWDWNLWPWVCLELNDSDDREAGSPEDRGPTSPSPSHSCYFHWLILEECPSGRRSTLGKRVCVNLVPWVRIPPPPKKKTGICLSFLLMRWDSWQSQLPRKARLEPRVDSRLRRLAPTGSHLGVFDASCAHVASLLSNPSYSVFELLGRLGHLLSYSHQTICCGSQFV